MRVVDLTSTRPRLDRGGMGLLLVLTAFLCWRVPLLAAGLTPPRWRSRSVVVDLAPAAGGLALLRMTGLDADPERSTAGNGNSSGKSLLTALDEAGQSLKPRAARATAKRAMAESKSRQFRYLAQASFYYALFILYRAYRGLFVLLPAVFKEVYRKLERAVDANPFDGNDNNSDTEDVGGDGSVVTVSTADIDPATGQVRLRTRATIAALAALVTAGYVVGGATRVAARFVRHCLESGGDVPASFAAAAAEQERNERTMIRRFGTGGRATGDPINGTDPDSNRGSKYSDLAP